MTIVQSLLSWIVYAAVGAFASEQLAATAAAATGVAVILRALRAGRHGSELIIEFASAAFFVGYACLAWIIKDSRAVAHWVSPVSQFWLAGAVGYGLLRRAPFTLAIAAREVPEAVRATPQFLAFNMTITRAWFASFLCSGLVLLIVLLTVGAHVWLNIACIVCAIVAPTLYTRRLVDERRSQNAGPPQN